MEVCLGANRSLRVLRARFSALVASELQRTIQRLVAPNAADAAAVDVRQEIDLRVGASFTRLQTLLLQVRLRVGAHAARPAAC
jgi:DNA topoisomerase-3